MKKIIFGILILSIISCTEFSDNKKQSKSQENVDLNELKKEKQKEIDSLKKQVRQLQQKKDSLKKVLAK